jgi:hypothetical protein
MADEVAQLGVALSARRAAPYFLGAFPLAFFFGFLSGGFPGPLLNQMLLWQNG